MKYQRGFTLVEILVAVLVFSIGLIGVAAMLGMTIKNHHNTHLRTHASLIASAVNERLRANPLAVSAGAYNATLQAGVPSLPNCPCDPAATALRDRRQLGDLAEQWLPDAQTTITCAGGALVALPGVGVPPFQGRCEVRVQWNEQRDIDAVESATPQAFTWVIQP